MVIGEPEWFAMRRGDVQLRLDPHYHRPHFAHLLSRLEKIRTSKLGALIGRSREMWNQKDDRYPIDFPYIEISGVGLGTDEYSVATIPTNIAPSRARQVVRADDILVSLTRPHRGAIVRVRKEDDGSIASTGFCVLRHLRSDQVSMNFLMLALGSSIGLDQMLMRSSGGNYPAITEDELANVLIPIPATINIQNDLVTAMESARAERRTKLADAEALLASLDGYIIETLGLTLPPKDERKFFAVQLCNLDKRVDPYSNQSRFKKLFAHIRESRYRVATFKELATRIFSGVTPLAKSDAYVSPPDGIRFIRSGEITADGEVTPTSKIHLSVAIHNGRMKNSQLELGDLLIAIVGATIGATGVFNREEPANINQAIAAVGSGSV